MYIITTFMRIGSTDPDIGPSRSPSLEQDEGRLPVRCMLVGSDLLSTKDLCPIEDPACLGSKKNETTHHSC